MRKGERVELAKSDREGGGGGTGNEISRMGKGDRVVFPFFSCSPSLFKYVNCVYYPAFTNENACIAGYCYCYSSHECHCQCCTFTKKKLFEKQKKSLNPTLLFRKINLLQELNLSWLQFSQILSPSPSVKLPIHDGIVFSKLFMNLFLQLLLRETKVRSL